MVSRIKTYTDGPCHCLCNPTWDTHPLVQAGSECWSTEFRGQIREEDCCWLCEDSLKELDCRAPQLRESGKKPGSAREARDHCRGVPEAHRGGPTT